MTLDLYLEKLPPDQNKTLHEVLFDSLIPLNLYHKKIIMFIEFQLTSNHSLHKISQNNDYLNWKSTDNKFLHEFFSIHTLFFVRLHHLTCLFFSWLEDYENRIILSSSFPLVLRILEHITPFTAYILISFAFYSRFFYFLSFSVSKYKTRAFKHTFWK